MLLKSAIESAFFSYEEGEIEIAERSFFVKSVLPDTKNAVIVVCVAVFGINFRKFSLCVDIEQKYAAGGDEVFQIFEKSLKLAVLGQIIDRIKRADSSLDRSVKIERAHVLAKQQRIVPSLGTGIPANAEHLGGEIDADRVKSALKHADRHFAGSAGEIEQERTLLHADIPEKLLEEVGVSVIIEG